MPLHLGPLTLALTGLVFASPVIFADALTDSQIRQQMIQESLSSYPGNCPCPWNTDRAGRRCGSRSAYNRAGGYSPICFANEISDEQVRAYREKRGSGQR